MRIEIFDSDLVDDNVGKKCFLKSCRAVSKVLGPYSVEGEQWPFFEGWALLAKSSFIK